MLLDECVDRRLAADIQGHDVKTVPEAGWASLKNGDLLSRAQHEFDVLVTTDRNLPFQQDLSRFSIAVIVLRAQSMPVLREAPVDLGEAEDAFDHPQWDARPWPGPAISTDSSLAPCDSASDRARLCVG